MNNGLKALLLAASTIITCIIVGLGFSLAKEAKQIGNYVTEELHEYRNTIEEWDFMKYDGVTVYGADVVNLMKKELYDDKGEIRITVNEGGSSRSYETKAEAETASDYENPAYIVPVSEYVGCVKRDANEVIVELVFTREE